MNRVGPLFAGQAGEAVGHLGVQVGGDRTSAEALHGRTCVVQGKVQRVASAAQLILPVGEQALETVPLEAISLAEGMLGVGGAGAGQQRFRAGQAGRVERLQLTEEHTIGSSVHERVVRGLEQYVIVLAEAEEHPAGGLAGSEVEAATRLLFHPGPERRLGGGDPVARDVLGDEQRGTERQHHLARLAVDHPNGRAERRVAPPELVEAPTEGIRVEATSKPERERDVVRRVSVYDSIQIPDPLLREGEGHALGVHRFGRGHEIRHRHRLTPRVRR